MGIPCGVCAEVPEEDHIKALWQDIIEIIKKRCKEMQVEIIEGETCQDHIYFPVFLITGACLVGSIVFAALHGRLSSNWKKLTINGTVLHPTIAQQNAQPSKKIHPIVPALVIAAVITLVGKYLM